MIAQPFSTADRIDHGRPGPRPAAARGPEYAARAPESVAARVLGGRPQTASETAALRARFAAREQAARLPHQPARPAAGGTWEPLVALGGLTTLALLGLSAWLEYRLACDTLDRLFGR